MLTEIVDELTLSKKTQGNDPLLTSHLELLMLLARNSAKYGLLLQTS